jgi:hypothetical protein
MEHWLRIVALLAFVLFSVFVCYAVRRNLLGLRRRVVDWCSSNRVPDILSIWVLGFVVWMNRWDAHSHATLGFVLARKGRRLAALLSYTQAYAVAIDGKQRAQAAYLAARINGLLERPSEAGRWLVVALDLNRHLLENARLDPDFKPVQGAPEFRRRIGASFDYGLDTDAP